MSMFNINFGGVSHLLLPPDKRKPNTLAFLRVVLQPLQTLRDYVLGTYRQDVFERTKYNGQTIVLESVLNKAFGVLFAPYIYIDNLDDLLGYAYLYNRSESNPKYISNKAENKPFYLRNKNEYSGDFDFIVYVPSALYTPLIDRQIRAQVDKYKIIGVNYNVLPY